jgi:hypothetical protein
MDYIFVFFSAAQKPGCKSCKACRRFGGDPNLVAHNRHEERELHYISKKHGASSTLRAARGSVRTLFVPPHAAEFAVRAGVPKGLNPRGPRRPGVAKVNLHLASARDDRQFPSTGDLFRRVAFVQSG